MPGTTVSMELNSLRMPSGASGFMSHMSCCGGPPHRYSRMQLLALAARAAEAVASARNRSGSASAPKPAWPKRIIASRRWSTAWDSLFCDKGPFGARHTVDILPRGPVRLKVFYPSPAGLCTSPAARAKPAFGPIVCQRRDRAAE